jgi:ribosome-binding factor A
MSSRRIAQVQDLIANELGAILLKELEFPPGSFPNILRVKVAADLKNATVWLGVFPPEKRAEVLQVINANIGQIQRLLNKRLVMKFVPRLLFKIDTTSDQVARISELVSKIKSEHESDK